MFFWTNTSASCRLGKYIFKPTSFSLHPWHLTYGAKGGGLGLSKGHWKPGIVSISVDRMHAQKLRHRFRVPEDQNGGRVIKSINRDRRVDKKKWAYLGFDKKEKKELQVGLASYVKEGKSNEKRQKSCLSCINKHRSTHYRDRFARLHYPRFARLFSRRLLLLLSWCPQLRVVLMPSPNSTILSSPASATLASVFWVINGSTTPVRTGNCWEKTSGSTKRTQSPTRPSWISSCISQAPVTSRTELHDQPRISRYFVLHTLKINARTTGLLVMDTINF